MDGETTLNPSGKILSSIGNDSKVRYGHKLKHANLPNVFSSDSKHWQMNGRASYFLTKVQRDLDRLGVRAEK